MSSRPEPFVSVLTPVYNGEKFLAECIESVLGQTHRNFEYVIVNNCSADRSFDIAMDYARRDSRIRVHQNRTFVGVIGNHNIAFGLVSPAARYCKVVSADDFIFPECIERMVRLAESNASIGIVGSYQLSGRTVRWEGFEFPRTVWPGPEICRIAFLADDPLFGFGTPTSLLYRADLVRDKEGFYPNQSPHADTSACFKSLRDCEFGFVYQVLSYERIHPDTESTASAQINGYASAYVGDLVQYGRWYLQPGELDQCLKRALAGYRRFLAVSMLGAKGDDFWEYHRCRLEELGYPMKRSDLAKALLAHLVRDALNPGLAIEKWLKRTRGAQRETAQKVPASPGTVRKPPASVDRGST